MLSFALVQWQLRQRQLRPQASLRSCSLNKLEPFLRPRVFTFMMQFSASGNLATLHCWAGQSSLSPLLYRLRRFCRAKVPWRA